jgi:hypothetical protein
MLANASIQNTTTPQVLPLCAALDDFPAYVELRRVPTAGSPLFAGMTRVGLEGGDEAVVSWRRLRPRSARVERGADR